MRARERFCIYATGAVWIDGVAGECGRTRSPGGRWEPADPFIVHTAAFHENDRKHGGVFIPAWAEDKNVDSINRPPPAVTRRRPPTASFPRHRWRTMRTRCRESAAVAKCGRAAPGTASWGTLRGVDGGCRGVCRSVRIRSKRCTRATPTTTTTPYDDCDDDDDDVDDGSDGADGRYRGNRPFRSPHARPFGAPSARYRRTGVPRANVSYRTHAHTLVVARARRLHTQTVRARALHNRIRTYTPNTHTRSSSVVRASAAATVLCVWCVRVVRFWSTLETPVRCKSSERSLRT